jgi:hypothetical protein
MCCRTLSNLDFRSAILCRFVSLSLPLISIRFNFGVERTHCLSDYHAEQRTCMSDCHCQSTRLPHFIRICRASCPQHWQSGTLMSRPWKAVPSIVLAPTFTDAAIIVPSDHPLSFDRSNCPYREVSCNNRGLTNKMRLSDSVLYGLDQPQQYL